MGELELRNCSILVAEDDHVLAFDVRNAFVKAGANVSYPVDTIEDRLDVVMPS